MDGRGIDTKVMSALVEDVSALKKEGRNVAIVTSGAVGVGIKAGRDAQTAAGVGQPKLMSTYLKMFDEWGIEVSQLLLTKHEFATGLHIMWKVVRPINIDFSQGIVTIINENDRITTKRTTLGDNDGLSSRVACAVHADAFILMSRKDNGTNGRGGGEAKYNAICKVERAGILAMLVDGKREHVIRDAFRGCVSGYESVDALKALHSNSGMKTLNADAKLNRHLRKKVK